MEHNELSRKAAQWAKSKVGCKYSQSHRLKNEIFDCSSLVARAYSAQGKQWKYGGSVPISTYEVYDDEFELLWPNTYAEIGREFGGRSVIDRAKRSGDLQFLCTNSKTARKNRITHVAMVLDSKRIVHARGTKYGVCVNDIGLYSGRVCAVVRYNPQCPLRLGMKGSRTLQLQKKLVKMGFKLTVDGEYGLNTERAVKRYQQSCGVSATGDADYDLLVRLQLIGEIPSEKTYVRIVGGTVNVRRKPGKTSEIVKVAQRCDEFERVDITGWTPIICENEICWVSNRYIV